MAHTHGSAAAANRGRLVAVLLLSLAIEHSTLQLETADRRRFEERSHA